jgi:hypothetical protein
MLRSAAHRCAESILGPITSLTLLLSILVSAGESLAARMTYEFTTDQGYFGTFSWDPDSTFDSYGVVSGAENALLNVWGPSGDNTVDITLYEPGGMLSYEASESGDIGVWVDRIYCDDYDTCFDHDFDALYFDLLDGTSIHFGDNTGLVFPYYTGSAGAPLPEFLKQPLVLSTFSSATINGMAITSLILLPEPSSLPLLAVAATAIVVLRRSSVGK